MNMIGRPYQEGSIELMLQRRFSDRERSIAGVCMRELVEEGLLEPTYADIAAPEEWLRITESGELAVERNALDELDHALFQLDPKLLDLRHGAWAASKGSQPGSVGQAAHSARELIRQVLDILAPIEAVRAQKRFKADPSSSSGVTRKMRVRLAVEKRAAGGSKSDTAVLERAQDLMLTLYDKLSGVAHDTGERSKVVEFLRLTESALRLMLVSRS
jgi:hypothetical protein